MTTAEITARSIITKSNLPEADYVITPYTGCSHACRYCYARFMKRFTGHSEPWGSFVDVKLNASDLIPEKSNKYRGRSVFLSSVTDPYLPQEREYGLTRQILKKLLPLEPRLGIQTKSDLIVRDIDILKKFDSCEAGLTLTTLDDSVRKEIEPGTSSISNRILALKSMHESGLTTYVFIGPILPELTDWKQIIKETRAFTSFYMFENLNMSGSIRNSVIHWLAVKHPSLVPRYESIYGKRNDYWDIVEEEITTFCRKEKLLLPILLVFFSFLFTFLAKTP